MRLGIYMGSFNPPHKGHLKIINHLIKKKYLDKILVVPTLSYWNKNDLAPINDRINMLKLFESENVIIDTKHNDLIYTYELVKEIEKEYPDNKISIIMGADNVVNLDKWKNYQKLLAYNIIIINRDGIDVTEYTSELNGNFTFINDLKPINVSSTEMRKKISEKYLDKKIIDYIKKYNLYQ